MTEKNSPKQKCRECSGTHKVPNRNNDDTEKCSHCSVKESDWADKKAKEIVTQCISSYQGWDYWEKTIAAALRIPNGYVRLPDGCDVRPDSAHIDLMIGKEKR